MSIHYPYKLAYLGLIFLKFLRLKFLIFKKKAVFKIIMVIVGHWKQWIKIQKIFLSVIIQNWTANIFDF